MGINRGEEERRRGERRGERRGVERNSKKEEGRGSSKRQKDAKVTLWLFKRGWGTVCVCICLCMCGDLLEAGGVEC